MHLKSAHINYLAALSQPGHPSAPDPSVTQSLRKQGLIVRNVHGQYELTLNGKQALEQAQKGKK